MNKKIIDNAVAKKLNRWRYNSYLKRRDVFNPNDSFISSTAMVIQIPLTLTE